MIDALLGVCYLFWSKLSFLVILKASILAQSSTESEYMILANAITETVVVILVIWAWHFSYFNFFSYDVIISKPHISPPILLFINAQITFYAWKVLWSDFFRAGTRSGLFVYVWESSPVHQRPCCWHHDESLACCPAWFVKGQAHSSLRPQCTWRGLLNPDNVPKLEVSWRALILLKSMWFGSSQVLHLWLISCTINYSSI